LYFFLCFDEKEYEGRLYASESGCQDGFGMPAEGFRFLASKFWDIRIDERPVQDLNTQ